MELELDSRSGGALPAGVPPCAFSPVRVAARGGGLRLVPVECAAAGAPHSVTPSILEDWTVAAWAVAHVEPARGTCECSALLGRWWRHARDWAGQSRLTRGSRATRHGTSHHGCSAARADGGTISLDASAEVARDAARTEAVAAN